MAGCVRLESLKYDDKIASVSCNAHAFSLTETRFYDNLLMREP